MNSEENTAPKTIYATHPLRPELKREANAAGLKIVDAAFAPPGTRIMDGQTGLPVGDLPAATGTATPPTEAQIRKMNKADLRELLAGHEIEAPAEATGAQLVELALPFAAQQD